MFFSRNIHYPPNLPALSYPCVFGCILMLSPSSIIWTNDIHLANSVPPTTPGPWHLAYIYLRGNISQASVCNHAGCALHKGAQIRE